MKTFKKTLLLMLVLVLGMQGFAEQAASTITVTDMAGFEIALDKPASRIVALAAADCEILYALGAGDLLVGRGEYCDYPEEVKNVESVQSGYQTNIEQLLMLEPDVVIMPIMSQTIEQEEALRAAGIQVVISDAQDIEGVYTAIKLLGAITAKNEEAAKLCEDMQAVFNEIRSDASGKTVYFEVSPLEWGLWTAGTGTFMNEIAQICGLENAFSDVSGWQAISEEQVLERDPDYIVTITMYYGSGLTPIEEIASRPGWDTLKAVSAGGIYNADSDMLSRPGPRLADAAKAFYDFITGNEAIQ